MQANHKQEFFVHSAHCNAKAFCNASGAGYKQDTLQESDYINYRKRFKHSHQHQSSCIDVQVLLLLLM